VNLGVNGNGERRTFEEEERLQCKIKYYLYCFLFDFDQLFVRVINKLEKLKTYYFSGADF
jgi:hypothetical protein